MDKKIKCPKCGHMNDASAEYCSNCGYKLHATKEASTLGFIQSMYKTAMSCPTATGDIALNTKNRDKTIKEYNYGPLNLSDNGYWEFVADKWNTTPEVAKKSKCGNCVAFDVSPRMDDCMPGQVSDKDGRLGYCWMHHFKCHSARTCTTWAKGGPIKEDAVSNDWQKNAKGIKKEALFKRAASAEYDDSYMLSKILLGIAEQSEDLREKIDNGLVLPSWAEYKVYGAYDNIKGALGASYMQDRKAGSSEKPLEKAAAEEDDVKSIASLLGAATAAGALSKAIPMGGEFAKNNPTARAMLYTSGLFSGGYAARKGVDSYRREKDSIKSRLGVAKTANSSSMVKSPDAYYAPTATTPGQPLETMNTGNVNQIANSAYTKANAAVNSQFSTTSANLAAPTNMPVPMTPMVQQPFRPKYTGM